MRNLLTGRLCLTAFVCFIAFPHVARSQQPPAGTIVYDVSPDELGKAFIDDAQGATKKYNAKGPSGGAGGAVINISGAVEIKGRSVYLPNESKAQIQLDNAPLPKGPGKSAADLKAAKFIRYDSRTKTIHLDGKGATYSQVIGK